MFVAVLEILITRTLEFIFISMYINLLKLVYFIKANEIMNARLSVQRVHVRRGSLQERISTDANKRTSKWLEQLNGFQTEFA